MVASSAGLGPKSDCSGKSRSNYMSKLQTHPLVKEGAQHQEYRNCQLGKKRKKENKTKQKKEKESGHWL
jgi:hypothetical protein